MSETFFGNFDLASLSIWLFWLFFALLIYYIQRENQREGYPLVNEDGTPAANLGIVDMPAQDKTFVLPHGRGSVSVPSGQPHGRNAVALRQTNGAAGNPFEPTGDPLVDGVGPASWADRRDVPELDGHGHAKIVPMAKTEDFHVSAGRDPRGLRVVSADKKVVGVCSDIWVDVPEHLVRYIQFDLSDEFGGGTKIVPITFALIRAKYVYINALNAETFANIPTTKSDREVTLLEEEKISAYYGGGMLYGTANRFGPVI